MIDVSIIGAGRAGRALAIALEAAGWPAPGVFGRGDDLDAGIDGVALVVIATDDRSIPEVAASIAPSPARVVTHLAGSMGLDALAGHPRRAALHPLVALPDPEIGARRLRGAWFAVAGDPLVLEVVSALGGRSFEIADDDRARYHAAAVVASNHLVALLGQAHRISQTVGVPADAVMALVRGTVDNVSALGPAAALTGPASRGDTETIRRHLGALPEDERATYRALAAEAERLAGRAPTLDDGGGRG